MRTRFEKLVLAIGTIIGLLWAYHSLPAQTTTPQPTVIPIGSNWKFVPSSGITSSGLYAGYKGSFSQDLGISPRTVQAPSPGWQYGTEGTYTFTFPEVNWFASYPGKYDVEITFGTQQLCEAYEWGTSRTTQVTLVCPSSNYMVLGKSLPGGGPGQGSNNLVLHFTVDDGSANGGWPVIFDPKKMSLTFTAANP